MAKKATAARGTCSACQADPKANPVKQVRDVEVEGAGGVVMSTKLCADHEKRAVSRK